MKNITIGIIGAENSHAREIAKITNTTKEVKGCHVQYIWGENKKFAEFACEYGNIPEMVSRPEDMLGKVDAMIVNHRHPKFHVDAALPYVKAGIPTFIDKPLAYKTGEAKSLIQAAKKKGTPVASYSVLPHQKSFYELQREIKKLGRLHRVSFYGPCDISSKYGDVFFYGIHQVDMVLRMFGLNVKKVSVLKMKKEIVVQVHYPDLMVLMNFIAGGFYEFGVDVIGDKGVINKRLTFDKNPYVEGVRIFCNMFKKGKEPEAHDYMLRPVQVLEAIQRAIKSGKSEKVV